MNNKSEFSFWFRDVQRASSFKGNKSAQAYLDGIEHDTLGLIKPQSASSQTKAQIMEPKKEKIAFEDVFRDDARNTFS